MTFAPFPPGSRLRWRRLDVPGREVATFGPTAGGWTLTGQLEVEEPGATADLRYAIDCDHRWRTRAARIAGRVADRDVAFDLVADGEGHWTRDGAPLPALDGTLDVDLGFTPSTNTLPIRRLDLAVGATGPVHTAWLRFPELRLERLEQTYTRLDERAYRYQAMVDGEPFVARLDTDALGRVVRYEGLWMVEGDG